MSLSSRIWMRDCLMPFVRGSSIPVDEMIFLICGRLESVTTDGGRSVFFNRSLLKEGDFCGEELLTWALHPKSGSNLPSSTRTVKAPTEVEAFALSADELKLSLVSSDVSTVDKSNTQSVSTRSSGVLGLLASFKQLGVSYSKRKILELRKKEEEAEELTAASNNAGGGSYSIGATFLASRFATNVLRGVHRNRDLKTARELVQLKKPPEPDFTADAD